MSVPQLLVEALDEIKEADLRRFQFFLNMKVLDGCRPIPKHRLENQSRDETAGLMIDFYGEESAVAVTNLILEKMGFNNIRRNLMRAYEEGRSSNATSSNATSSSAPPPPPPAAVTMSAQEGSVVIAPTITSGTIGTLTISVTKP